MSNSVASDRLRSFIERIERLKEEIASLQADIKEIKAEAKGEGFSIKTINEIIKLRAMDAAERQEHEALLDLYKAALGMLDGTPLGRAALDRINNPPKDDKHPPDDAGSGDDDPIDDDGAVDEPPAPPDEPPDEPSETITDEDIAAARERGGNDARDGLKILSNPFVAGDPRRAAWDEGWCQAMGSDGMDLPSALRPSKKSKKPADPDDGGGE